MADAATARKMMDGLSKMTGFVTTTDPAKVKDPDGNVLSVSQHAKR